MKIICKKNVLSENINIVSKAVSGKTTLPILECILLSASSEGFKLLANDLEIGIETKPIEAEVVEEGNIALDAKMLSDIVRRASGDDILIETTKNNVTVIKSRGSEYKILGQAGDEFPHIPEVERESCFELPSNELKNMIRQTIFSVSSDESKPAMTGELFSVSSGVLKIASSDGFRISVRSIEIDNAELTTEAIVPGKTLSEIFKILPSDDKSVTTIYLSEKHIMFETEEAIVVSRILEGKFIDYESLFLADCTTSMTVLRAELNESLERASLISRGVKKNSVKLTIDDSKNVVVVESNTETGTFYEEIDVEVDGLNLEIGFNPKFLMDILKSIDEENVTLFFATPLSPCTVKGIENKGFKYLVLPIRL